MSKKIIEMSPVETIAMNIELAHAQTEFSTEVFKIAKKFGVDECDALRMVGNVIIRAATDEFFVENVAPMLRDVAEAAAEAEG